MTSRRTFLATAALTAASYNRVRGANDRVGLGFIGYGLMGKGHVATFRKLEDVDVVAISDCHAGRVKEGVSAAGGKATGYADFRKLLDDNAVAAVVIATPDHWHAPMTMLACAAGKDVYVEKPLTLFVREGEWVQAVAAREKRVVQVGTQQRSGKHYQRACELIRGGHLGTVTSVRITTARNVSPGFGNPPDGPPPAGFDYVLWLGPAPARAYNPNRGLYHFRWFWDYSGGQLTNLGTHQLDIVDWAIGLGSLKAVTGVGGRFTLSDNGETPDTQDVLFDCGKFTVAFGMREAAHGEKATYGLSFHGTHGSLGIDRKGFRVVADSGVPPANLIPGVKEGHPAGGPIAAALTGKEKPRTEAVEDLTGDSAAQYLAHARDFIDCVKSRRSPASDLASAHRTAVACHLGNLSMRLGRSLRWDWKAGTVPQDAEAAGQLVRRYQAPWDKEIAALIRGADRP